MQLPDKVPLMPRWLQIITALGGLTGILAMGLLIFRPEPEQPPFAPISVERPLQVEVQDRSLIVGLKMCNTSTESVDVIYSYSFQSLDSGQVVAGRDGILPRPPHSCIDRGITIPLPDDISPGIWRMTGRFLSEERDDRIQCPTPSEPTPTCIVFEQVLRQQSIAFDSEEFDVQ